MGTLKCLPSHTPRMQWIFRFAPQKAQGLQNDTFGRIHPSFSLVISPTLPRRVEVYGFMPEDCLMLDQKSLFDFSLITRPQ